MEPAWEKPILIKIEPQPKPWLWVSSSSDVMGRLCESRDGRCACLRFIFLSVPMSLGREEEGFLQEKGFAFSFHFIFFIYHGAWCMPEVCVGRSVDKSVGWLLSFYLRMGSGYGTHAVRLLWQVPLPTTEPPRRPLVCFEISVFILTSSPPSCVLGIKLSLSGVHDK